jgi:hypothetical protein
VVTGFQKPIWLVMTCAAFVAQVVPQPWSGDCDRGCCAAEELTCCTVTLAAPFPAGQDGPAEADTGCPLCAAAEAGGLSCADDSPCHCQLDTRQEQPLSAHGASSPHRDELSAWVAADATSLEALHELGVSRSYAAASLSIPIRPVRILYGVWRT